MKKLFVVTETPSVKEKLVKNFDNVSNLSYDCLQPVFSINEEISSVEKTLNDYFGTIELENGLVPLKLKFFKDAENFYMIIPAEKVINCDSYDYILFVTEKNIVSFHKIIEYCERNNIVIDKALYKESADSNIFDIDKITHLFDMSIDDFNN